MTNHQEQITKEQHIGLVQENISEIAMMIGCLTRGGEFPKNTLDIPSSDINQCIISWAQEFEDKYQGPDFDYSKGVPELGNPLGYLDAIDNFTDLKMRNAGWLTDTYIADKGRFWNKPTVKWTCPNECDISHVLVCGGDLGNPDDPNHYFQMKLDGTYTNHFSDGSPGVPEECFEHADGDCGNEPCCPECRAVCVDKEMND